MNRGNKEDVVVNSIKLEALNARNAHINANCTTPHAQP